MATVNRRVLTCVILILTLTGCSGLFQETTKVTVELHNHEENIENVSVTYDFGGDKMNRTYSLSPESVEMSNISLSKSQGDVVVNHNGKTKSQFIDFSSCDGKKIVITVTSDDVLIQPSGC